MNVDVDLEVTLREEEQIGDLEALVKKAVDRALDSVEKFLRGLECNSRK